MIDKFKRFINIDNADVVPPPAETCVFLNNVRGVYLGDTGSDPTSTEVRYIACGDETNKETVSYVSVGMTPTEPYEELVINSCIKSGSLYVGGVNITNESPTGVPFWSITADFGTICISGGECVYYTITVTVPQDLTFILTPCGGEETPYTLNSDGTSTYSQCTASITYLPPNGGKYTLEVGDVCSF
jgi:hypothetical protein